MTTIIKYTLPLIIGIALGVGFSYLRVDPADNLDTASDQQDEPLYWVAPMDANYRRDKPGKSPMGMDLVPVYAERDQAGVVEISPQVINNLGVRKSRAERTRVSQDIRTVGYVQYDQDRLVHIHPRVEGWIEKLHIKASGDPVVKGEPLYDIYSPQLVNAQEEMVLALRRGNERLLQASEDRLLALQLTPEFIATLKRDRVVRQTVTFRSPQDGVVDNLNIREGFYVGPNTTLMSIGTLEKVWVEAEVFGSNAGMVHPGQPVTMRLDYFPGKEWRGEVDYIYPSLDATTRTLRVRLRFDNADGKLRPNMYARILIHSTDDSDTLTIPREALIRTGDQDRVVLAMGNGRFKSVEVRAGRHSGGRVEILQGLSEGEEIVSSAQFLLDSESSRTSDFRRMEHDHD
jgi:Cu(I)/Ag(I) efflux system membrane fusion protein